jgi:hypothetical protein
MGDFDKIDKKLVKNMKSRFSKKHKKHFFCTFCAQKFFVFSQNVRFLPLF